MLVITGDLTRVLRDIWQAGPASVSTIGWALLAGGLSGWCCFVYGCFWPDAGVTARSQGVIAAVGVVGMAVTLAIIDGPRPRDDEFLLVATLAVGLWVLNALGVVKIRLAIRRLRDASNAED